MLTTSALHRVSSALLLGGAMLLLAACNNQYPGPPPVPGQPLTWAQQHKLDVDAYQTTNLDRFNY